MRTVNKSGLDYAQRVTVLKNIGQNENGLAEEGSSRSRSDRLKANLKQKYFTITLQNQCIPSEIT